MRILFCLASLLLLVGCTPGVEGTWNIRLRRDEWQQSLSAVCRVQHRSKQFIVDCGDGTMVISARLMDRQFTWEFLSGPDMNIRATFSGQLVGSKAMKGTWTFLDSSDQSSGGGTFEATLN